MTAERSEQVMVRLTPEVYAELKRVSDEQERTDAQTVRLAIRQHLAAITIVSGFGIWDEEKDELIPIPTTPETDHE